MNTEPNKDVTDDANVNDADTTLTVEPIFVQVDNFCTHFMIVNNGNGSNPVKLEIQDDAETGNINTLTIEHCDGQVQYLLPESESITTETTYVESKPVVTPIKKHLCTIESCNKSFASLNHLKTHERIHAGDRPYECCTCHKAFTTTYARKAHMRVHTGEKPYVCSIDGCLKMFKTSGDLRKHIRTHTGEKPFRCEVCGKSFTTSNIRKVHMRVHTGERPYKCTYENCGRTFSSATNYKNHHRIHTGEKPFVCSIENCGKRFTEYSSLYKHHMVHNNQKRFTCNFCGRSYRQLSTLAVHKKTAHPTKDDVESVTVLSEVKDSLEEHQIISSIESLEPLQPEDGIQEDPTYLEISEEDYVKTLQWIGPIVQADI